MTTPAPSHRRNQTLLEVVSAILVTMVDPSVEYIDRDDYDTVLALVYGWIGAGKTPEWQAKEAEADADLREGRFKEFDNVEDMIRFLGEEE